MLSFLEKARKKPATMNRTMISLIMAFLAILWLVFSGIQDASLFFYFPTEVEQSISSDEMEQDARIRIGGFVQPDSISVEDEVIFAKMMFCNCTSELAICKDVKANVVKANGYRSRRYFAKKMFCKLHFGKLVL